MIHGRFALTDNHIYQAFGKTALIPRFRQRWTSVVMSNIAFFALLRAAFEMTTGILILSRGKFVKLGLAASVLFNLCFWVHFDKSVPELLGALAGVGLVHTSKESVDVDGDQALAHPDLGVAGSEQLWPYPW
jgi:hypothetical protein